MGDCDRGWEVDVHREGRLGHKDAESFERHLRACRDCRLLKERGERLRALGQSLPQVGPSELSLRRLRTRVLRDVATGAVPRAPASRTRSLVGAAAAMALAVLGGWLALRRPALPPTDAVATVTPVATMASEALAGAVTAMAGARWTQAREQGVERVTLGDGTIAAHVRHQQRGERFLVVLPDGELEVRGTTFDVTVDRGATRRVHVDEGLVELRLAGAAAVRLGAGETWTPPDGSPPPVVAPGRALAARPPPAASAEHPPIAETSDDGAQAYAQAVQLLRAGRGDDAAAALHAFLLAYPAAAQAEDASFLEAVALARAGRVDAAALAAEHHLASFPGSFHRKEAAILVARAAGQRGDCARARSVLAPWAGGPPDDDVRRALGACADSLGP